MERKIILLLFTLFFKQQEAVSLSKCPDYNDATFKSRVRDFVANNPTVGIVVTPKATQYTVRINHAIIQPFQKQCQDISLHVNPNTGNITKKIEDEDTIQSVFSVKSIIPCEKYKLTVVLKGKTGSGSLELHKTVEPATKQQLNKYNYKLAPPTHTKYNQNSSILSWKPVTCATMYNVKIMVNNTKNPLVKTLNVSSPASSAKLDDYVKPCTRYRYQIRALYYNYSKFEIQDFMTGPNKNKIEKIKFNLDIKKISVVVNISIPEELSCVQNFDLLICQKKVANNCFKQSFNYSVNVSIPFSNLNDNTSYIVSLTPVYNTQPMEKKEKEFITKELIEHVNISKIDHDEIQITWTNVNPLPSPYIVYSQKITNKTSGSKKFIHETKLNSVKAFQMPCQRMRYGITIGKGINRKIKWSKEYTNDISKNFSSLDLKLMHSFANKSTVNFTWQHVDMIKNYSLQFCKSGTNISCVRQYVTPGLSTTAEFMAKMKKCSGYTLQIIPTSICGKQGQPITKEVNTVWENCNAKLKEAGTSWIRIGIVVIFIMISVTLTIGTMRYKAIIKKNESSEENRPVSQQVLGAREVLPDGFKQTSNAMRPPGFTDVIEVDKSKILGPSSSRNSIFAKRGRVPSLSMSFQSVRVLYR